MFDSPLKYDYLARPLKLKPNTLASMPEISPDGLTYTLRVKPGIYFADDPVFKGKKRELVAEDYVYTIKRLMDPKLAAPLLAEIEGIIARQRRGAREGAQGQQVRLRRAHRGPEGAGPLHLPDQAHEALSTCSSTTSPTAACPARWRARWSSTTATTSARTRWARGRTARPLEALLQAGVRAQSRTSARSISTASRRPATRRARRSSPA